MARKTKYPKADKSEVNPRVIAMARALAHTQNRLPDQLVKEEAEGVYTPYGIAPMIQKHWNNPIWRMFVADATIVLETFDRIMTPDMVVTFHKRPFASIL